VLMVAASVVLMARHILSALHAHACVPGQVLALDWRQPGFCIAFVWDATDIQPTEKQ
jgi:hypothetical protein